MSVDRICNYSSIIFALNVWVLLLVALLTDYWEYRGFKFEDIAKQVTITNKTQHYFPLDTNSYYVIKYFWDSAASKTELPDGPGHEVHYQSPSFVNKYFKMVNVTYEEVACINRLNITVKKTRQELRNFEESIILYYQYGNLYRDCEALEEGVRKRLGLTEQQQQRCMNFILNPRTSNDYIQRELPAVIHLERSAFALGFASILAATISNLGGTYGCLTHDWAGLVVASVGALASGVLLTMTIAVFHGKCHLIHRHEFMAGIQLPYKQLLDEARDQHYGWSFVLAWLCVVMLLILAWVWLDKSQNYNIHSIRHAGGMFKLEEESSSREDDLLSHIRLDSMTSLDSAQDA